MRISDWSSDVCSSELPAAAAPGAIRRPVRVDAHTVGWLAMVPLEQAIDDSDVRFYQAQQRARWFNIAASVVVAALLAWALSRALLRSEEHTSELQSLMRISYAVFCLKKKKNQNHERRKN